jgi:hypothetical protein
MVSGYDDGELLHQRGFRSVESGRTNRPFQVNGDQVRLGVGRPLRVSATSPSPGAEVQPSGTATVIRGAAGSETVATPVVPMPLGCGKHANAFGEMCSGNVVSTPGTAVCVVGVVVVAAGEASSARTAVPALILSHAHSKNATAHARPSTAAHSNLTGISVT